MKTQLNIIAILIISLVMLGKTVHAQSNVRLHGRVFRADLNEPLPDAFIELEGTSYFTRSDEDGYFALENIPAGFYRLVISAPGFQSEVRNLVQIQEGQPTKLIVSLQPIVIPGDTVTVSSTMSPFEISRNTQPVRIISRKEIEQFSSLGIRPLLEQVAGVRVESVSGEGSRARIRIHGSRASQVLVLLDGQRLNNPQTGEVDISRIPLNQIERIEVDLQGNTARYGSSAFEGVVHFYTHTISRQTNMKLSGRLGSFGLASGGILFQWAGDTWGATGNFHQNYARQNFPYKYQGETYVRENAYFRNRDVFLKGVRHTGINKMAITASWHHGVRGLPSPYFNEYLNYGAFLKERQWSAQISQQFFPGNNVQVEWQAGIVNLQQHYHNENDPVVYTQYSTQQTNRNLQATLNLHWQINPRLLFTVGGEAFQEYLNQKISFTRKTVWEFTGATV